MLSVFIPFLLELFSLCLVSMCSYFFYVKLKNNKSTYFQGKFLLFAAPLISAAIFTVMHYQNYLNSQLLLNEIIGQQIGYFSTFEVLENLLALKSTFGQICIGFSVIIWMRIIVILTKYKNNANRIEIIFLIISVIILYFYGSIKIKEQDYSYKNVSNFDKIVSKQIFFNMMSFCPGAENLNRYLILSDNYTLLANDRNTLGNNVKYYLSSNNYEVACKDTTLMSLPDRIAYETNEFIFNKNHLLSKEFDKNDISTIMLLQSETNKNKKLETDYYSLPLLVYIPLF